MTPYNSQCLKICLFAIQMSNSDNCFSYFPNIQFKSIFWWNDFLALKKPYFEQFRWFLLTSHKDFWNRHFQIWANMMDLTSVNVQNKSKEEVTKTCLTKRTYCYYILYNTAINISGIITLEHNMIEIFINWLYKLFHQKDFRFRFEEF